MKTMRLVILCSATGTADQIQTLDLEMYYYPHKEVSDRKVGVEGGDFLNRIQRNTQNEST
jgi:hypothetical protein